MIAQRPHVAAKIRDELNEVFGENELPSYDNMGKLRYLTMVIKEVCLLRTLHSDH
jgi:hypothetical protein